MQEEQFIMKQLSLMPYAKVGDMVEADCMSAYHHLYTPLIHSQKYLYRNPDCNPEDVPIYMGHSLFNTTKCITLLFIIQSFLHCNSPNNWIEII